MRLLLSVVRGLVTSLVTLALLAAPAFAQRLAPKLDYYGDPLPPGAVGRLGTKRLQTKGGFGWTPDGKSLATLRGGTVSFWDLEDGHCRETLLVPVNPDPFFTYGAKFVLSKDGQRLVCADDSGTLATWDLANSQTASEAGESKKERNEANVAVALHPDGKRFITLHKNGELNIRDFATCKVQRSTAVKVHYWSQGTSAAFSPDGKLLALGQDTTDSIHLLDIETDAAPVVIKKVHSQSLYHVEFLPDGRLISVGAKRGPMGTADDPQPQDQVLIWDLSKQPPSSREFPLADTQPAGCSATFSADGKTLVTVHRDRLHVWDVPGEKLLRQVEGPRFRNPMHAIVSIDPTGRFVAVDDRQNYVRIWELATGKAVLSTEQHHQGGVYGMDWSPSGERIATGDFFGEVRVWDAATGEPLRSFRGPDWGTFSLRYTPDATQLILCGDQAGLFHPKLGTSVIGPVRWHDAESGRRLRDVPLAGRARLLRPSPDGSRIAVATEAIEDDADPLSTGGPPAVRLLDANTGRELGKVELDKEAARALGWSADSKTLFAVAASQVVPIDARSLRAAPAIELPHFREDYRTKLPVVSGIHQAAFLRHAAEVVTSSGMWGIYLWKLPGGAKLWTIKTPERQVRALVPSPDQKLLAAICVADDEQTLRLRLFDLASRREIGSFDLGRNWSDKAAFSPDGDRILVGFNDGTALVYDISDFR